MADVTSTFAAKDVGFSATINRMQRSLAGFQTSLSGFGARVAGLAATFIGVQAAMSAFKNGLDMAGRLNDLSVATGETAGNLALLERAFANNGMAAENVGPIIGKMAKFVVALREGSASATDAATTLGISVADLAGKTPIQQMQILAKAIDKIPDPMQRAATAMSVFGKSGRAILPLAADFSGEMANARAELGSLIPILDANAASLDQLGDKLGNAVGGKFKEMAIGFAAGVTGANDFVTALSRIDAAGFGKKIGDALRIAFDSPLASAKAIGYTLLTGAQMAGNALINGSLTAADLFVKTVGSKDYAEGLGLRIRAGLLEAVNAFNKVLASSIKTIILEPFASLPGLIGDPFRAALKSVESIQATLDATSRYNYDLWNKGGKLINGSVDDALVKVKVINKDWLGVAQSASDAARWITVAKTESSAIREEAAAVEQSFASGSAALTNALNEIRGFDISGKETEERPDWTKSNQPPPSGSGGGSGGGGGGGGRASDRKLTRNERIAEMRGNYRARSAEERADQLEAKGMFASADAARRRGERRRNDAMQKGRLKDLYAEEGGATNFGEAYRNYRERTGMDRMSEKEYKADLDSQLKSTEERLAEEEALRDKHGTKGKGADSTFEILDLLKKHIPKIDEKLPQTALVYS